MRPIFRLLPILLLGLSCSAYGTGFDIELKELQKPLYPASVATSKKKAVSSPRKNKPGQQSESTSPGTYKTVETPPTPSTAVAGQAYTEQAVTSVTAELMLKAGDSCRLSEQVAVAVARTVPAERLLNGLSFRTIAAVTEDDLQLLVSCGLADAEAYTYNRLLEEHHVQLLNTVPEEPTSMALARLLEALALTYQVTNNGANGSSYLIEATGTRGRPLRIIVQ